MMSDERRDILQTKQDHKSRSMNKHGADIIVRPRAAVLGTTGWTSSLDEDFFPDLGCDLERFQD